MASSAAAVAATALAAGTASEARKRPWKKAVMFGMIQGGATILEKFKILKEAGFDGVELNAPKQHNMAETLAAMKETGIQCEGVVDAVHWHTTLSDPDEKKRTVAVEALKGALRECKEFGGTSVLLVPAVVNKQVSYADAYKRSQEEIA
jgi:L-ribulose-5-phosphate 3-epimerase